MDGIEEITAEVTACRRCDRLVAWREAVAADPPAPVRGQSYWARALPRVGDLAARVLGVALPRAASGGNRTGRIFTGDPSGDWLYRALHRAGFASQPVSVSRDDGLKLTDCYIAAVVRCAPPDNRPLPEERDHCLPFLAREIAALRRVRVVLALGAFAWDGTLRALRAAGFEVPRPKPVFGHGAQASVGPYRLLGSYHPSQRNTSTGLLSEAALDEVVGTARSLLSAT